MATSLRFGRVRRTVRTHRRSWRRNSFRLREQRRYEDGGECRRTVADKTNWQ